LRLRLGLFEAPVLHPISRKKVTMSVNALKCFSLSAMTTQLQAQAPRRGVFLSAMAAACVLALANGPASAQSWLPQPTAEPAQLAQDTLDPNAVVRVIVQFNEPAVSAQQTNFDMRSANRAQINADRSALLAAKAPRLAAMQRMGARVQNTLEFALNGAVMDVPAGQIAAIRALAGVKSVRVARIYQMNQAAAPSVQQLIGTLAANNSGFTGRNVAIAIIDSGVDYTHASFGGPGTTAYYANAVAGTNPTTLGAHIAGVFPNGPRVKGGYDWLGDTWANSATLPGGFLVTPDPNPIDNKQIPSDFAGHGTNSASAAAGLAVAAGNIRPGSAPEAMLLAYRGCSRITTSCEGSALLNSVESVIAYAGGQPNFNQPGANNPVLPAGTRFVINMSLGASSGSPATDDLSEASRNAVRAGITVVASAGNANDIPMITGTPSAADTVISVAASQPALLTGPALTSNGATYPLIAASFGVPATAPFLLPMGFAGPNNTLASNINLACAATGTGTPTPGPAASMPDLTGRIGIADRGTCGFNEKGLSVSRTDMGGGRASVVLIVNNAVGAGPVGMGAATPPLPVAVPVYSIGTAEGAALKAALIGNPLLTASFALIGDVPNATAGINLVDAISDFSSRGAAQDTLALKPDVTAPGSNIWMANVGTGTGGAPNSGTSFSSPLTAGAAALVLSARPNFTPWQVKAALMNTANPNVFTASGKTSSTAGPLVGMTRMGAGRIQTDRAVATNTLVYDSQDIESGAGVYYNAGISFGMVPFSAPGASSVQRSVTVQNLSSSAKTYNLSVQPRFTASTAIATNPNDTTKGISFSTSVPSLTVAANSSATFNLVASVPLGTALPRETNTLPRKLAINDMCAVSASNPSTPNPTCTNKFNDIEQDGLVVIDGGADTDRVTVPYLMYPRQASVVTVSRLGTNYILRNTGAANSAVDVFNLLGTEQAATLPPVVPGGESLPIDIRAVGVRFTPSAIATPPAGVTSGDVLEFAVSLRTPVVTARLATINVEIDTNNDGTPDFTVSNLNTTTNVSSAFIRTGTTGTPGNGFFQVATALNSSQMQLSVFPSIMGINASSRIGIRVKSSNGNLDFFPVLVTYPSSGAFQYVTLNRMVNRVPANAFIVPTGANSRLSFSTNSSNSAASPADKGLLMIFRDNTIATESAILQLVN